MANTKILQWPPQKPLHLSPLERATETAHKIAEVGPFRFAGYILNPDYIKIWLEDFRYQHKHRNPRTTPENEQMGSWVIRVYPTHPLYELILADKPIKLIEFLFSDEPQGGWYPTEPSSYLIVKNVR